jgi:hypothetical protein
MIDDSTPQAHNRGGDASVLMMNMASIDSNSDFANGSMSASASNTLNNKKNRKLKRVGQAST